MLNYRKRLKYVKNNIKKIETLHILESKDVERVTNRVNTIKKNIGNSKITLGNYAEKKAQTKKIKKNFKYFLVAESLCFKGFASFRELPETTK